MTLTQMRCAHCGGKSVEGYRSYTIAYGEQRTMYYCSSCGRTFSETRQKTPQDFWAVCLAASWALVRLGGGYRWGRVGEEIGKINGICVLALRQRMPCGSSTYCHLEGLGSYVHGSYGV